jgi:hypothetical protein
VEDRVVRAGAGILASLVGAIGYGGSFDDPVRRVSRGRSRRGNPSSGYLARLMHKPMRDAADFAEMSADDRRRLRNARKQERRQARARGARL